MDLLNYQPEKPFSQKHLLNLQSYSKDEIFTVLSLAMKLKAENKAGVPHPVLKGKTLGMIFAKSSMELRCGGIGGIARTRLVVALDELFVEDDGLIHGHWLYLTDKDLMTAEARRHGSDEHESSSPHPLCRQFPMSCCRCEERLKLL